MTLDLKSQRLLQGVHPDLVSVVERASELTQFRITEGLRTKERQKKLVAEGKSRTMNSRHLTGHAIDFVTPTGSYDDAEMTKIAEAFKAASGELGIQIVWGGDWPKFRDTPHIELEWHSYPASSFAARAKAVALGVGTGSGAVSIPQVPQSISTGLTRIEEHIAIGGRMASMFKGVLALEPGALFGIAGLLMAAACVFLPSGGQHAVGGAD